MSASVRKFHHVVAPWIFAVLLVSLTTGIIYRVGRAWFGMSRATGNKLMDIHTGGWMGESAPSWYVPLVGLALLALVVTGAVLLFKSRSGKGARGVHRILGAMLMIPLAASALTGALSQLGGDWFHFSDKTQDILMSIHEGGWLGKTGKPFYVLFVGLGLLALGIYGLRLTRLFKRKAPAR